MAIAVVATEKIVGASGGTSASFDSTGANCIAIFLAYGGSPTVSDNKGNTYTAGTSGSNTVAGRWYYCLGATTGTGHTVTIGGGSVVASCVILALSGVKTTAAYNSPGATSFNSATSDSFSVDVTPGFNDAFVAFGLGFQTATISAVTGSNGWTVPQWTSGVGGTNYGSAVAYKIQTTAATVPAAEQLMSWTGSCSGINICAYFEPAAGGGGGESLTLTTPKQYEVHQRSGSTGSIQISGTVGGSTEDIEASFNGGAYVTIASAVAPGAFSGTLTGQSQGQGTLTVRKKTTTSTSATVADVGIGDVFVVGGDSISEGRGTNAQSYTHASLKAAKFTQADAWGNGNDGIDTGTSSGSHWPLLATRIMADQGVPVAFISTGTGSTDVAGSANSWAKPNTEYTGLTSQVSDSTASSVKAVLMHLGPNAVVNASTLSQATYNSAIDTLANNIATDVSGAPKLHIGIFGEVSTGSPPDRTAALNNLRAAIIEAQGDNANVKPGPCLIDLDYTDGVHPQSNTHLQAVADRWWIAIKESLYSGSGGRGPRFSSAQWNAGRTQLTVVFDRTLKTGLTHATQPWAVSDNGSAMTVNSVAYHGTNAAALVLTTSAAATGPNGSTTVTFSSGDTAVGRVVPMSADIALPGGAGNTQIPAEPFYSRAVAELTATTVTVTLTTNGSTPAASLTGLRWAFFDQPLPNNMVAPVAKGTGETTDGSGVLVLDITGTALVVGAVGWLIVTDSDGNPATNHSAFCGPVVVS